MSDTPNIDSSFQERNNQTLNDIKQLQTQEMDIYKSLDNVSLSQSQKQALVNQMNNISQMRINLYANLNNMYSSYSQNVGASRNTLDEQVVAVEVVEEALNEAKIRLNALETEKYNKLRMVEVNTYYSKQYGAYTDIMKTLVYFGIPIFILVFLGNKGLIPSNIYGLLIGILMIISLFTLGYKIIDLIRRDNMNFDEYNWYFDKSKAPNDSTGETNPVDPWAMSSLTCMGEECCYAGSTYDSTTNMCVPDPAPAPAPAPAPVVATPAPAPAPAPVVDTFVNIGDILGKYGTLFNKPVAYL